MRRALAVILSADVVGYSRLMATDDVGALNRVRDYWAKLSPIVEERGGRVVKRMGDGALMLFESVEGAVQAALATQERIFHMNAGRDPDGGLSLRIGISLGDVIVEDEDVFGDAVIMATRLQGLASPGAVAISGAVRDQIISAPPRAPLDLGHVTVKGAPRPLRVFQLLAVNDPREAEDVAETARRRAQRESHLHLAANAAGLAGPDLGGYSRHMVGHYEGEYRCFRRGFTDPGLVTAYGMRIAWSDEDGGLVFHDENPGYEQSGRIAMPIGAPFVHFLTLDSGSARLITTTHMPVGRHMMTGLSLTLANPSGVTLTPAAAPMVIVRTDRLPGAAAEAVGRFSTSDPQLAGAPLDAFSEPPTGPG